MDIQRQLDTIAGTLGIEVHYFDLATAQRASSNPVIRKAAGLTDCSVCLTKVGDFIHADEGPSRVYCEDCARDCNSDEPSDWCDACFWHHSEWGF